MHIERYPFNMHRRYIPRYLEKLLQTYLKAFPAVAILGPRQCGKSTLAKKLLGKIKKSVYLDLEKPSDLRKLETPELFFEGHRKELVCLDEIQRRSELFPYLRSIIDEQRRPGQFLILGSASPELIRESSETLAGRIGFLELTPFQFQEVSGQRRISTVHWTRGGFPGSLLARSNAVSFEWRLNFVRTFLERDIPQLGSRIPSRSLERLWRMCAHYHGQLLNLSQLAEAIGTSHPTIRSYLELLEATFMVRLLPPLLPNLRKRLVKSPRLYVRDSGILHSLLDLDTRDDLLGHPVAGASWEGWVIENILSLAHGWRGSFYRTASGTEIDLVLEKGKRRIAVECKLSKAPQPRSGFWTALSDLEIRDAWIIAPVEDHYPIARNVSVAPLEIFLRYLSKQSSS